MKIGDLVHACRVPASVAERRVGLWEIRRLALPRTLVGSAIARSWAQLGDYDDYTALFRDTTATLHQERGEVVMEDTPRELKRHLPILLAARGRVLVTGLGLGCVLRGLLANSRVDHIDVVEIDPAIVKLVGNEFENSSRVRIHLADALDWTPPAGTRYDFAWHDVWSEHEHLDLVHARMLVRYEPWCDRQGAWQMTRTVKRRLPKWYIGGPRRRTAA